MAVSAYVGALSLIADLNSRLGITSPTQDDFLQTLINAASRRIELHTHRRLKQRTYTNALFNGNGRQIFAGDPLIEAVGPSLASGDTLQQSAWGRRLETPLAEVTAITLDDVIQTIGDDPDVSDIQVVALGDPSGLGDHLYRAHGWTKGINNLRITYKGGFPTVPEDLAEACIVTVMAWFFDKERKYVRILSYGAQGESVTLEKTALPTVAQDLLAPFVRPTVIGL